MNSSVLQLFAFNYFIVYYTFLFFSMKVINERGIVYSY